MTISSPATSPRPDELETMLGEAQPPSVAPAVDERHGRPGDHPSSDAAAAPAEHVTTECDTSPGETEPPSAGRTGRAGDAPDITEAPTAEECPPAPEAKTQQALADEPLAVDAGAENAPTADDCTLSAGPLLSAQAAMLAEALVAERGPVSSWRCAPRRSGLASAVIDAVMTPRVTGSTVDAVVTRFERACGADAGVSELLRSFEERSDAAWRDEIGTRHRTHSRLDAPFKSDVVARAAALLRDRGIETREDLVAHAHDDDLRAAWCALPGQSSGFTWRHLLLAAGCDEPLVCPLTRRFVRRHLGRTAAAQTDEQVLDLMTSCAATLGTDVMSVDHQIWRAARS